MPTVSLAQLRERVLQKVDMVGSDFVEDAELAGIINRALFALDDKLHAARRDYYLTEESVTVTGERYALPPAFYQLVGVDVQASTGEWVSLHPYEWSERNTLRNLKNARPEEVRYKVVGADDGTQGLSFLPAFSAPTSVLLHYYPQREPLVLESDTVTYPQAWEEWAVLRAAIEVRTKEERDTGAFAALLALEEARIAKALPVRDVVEPTRMAVPGDSTRRMRLSRR